ncbi:YqgE/AlgH family protein [Breoghania sp.]|uniref:YqgE/AlgH family protein n=1 Tax=Breoghania sp. TaxID=2065378 RepID=UPI002AAB34D0|nr:YqgE/AlgH family protein [Breoghania sp.]
MQMAFEKDTSESAGTYLDGQLLIAMPTMADERFERSVIYMCAHSAEGAMGLILNKLVDSLSLPELLSQLGIIEEDDAIRLPHALDAMPVHRGGPVETGRGFVLHSSDYFAENSTLAIEKGICLTATLEILKAMAEGRGPANAMLALGYAGWSAGQLESEIQANGWLTCPADEALVFGRDLDRKYLDALGRLGISPGMLSCDAGHA